MSNRHFKCNVLSVCLAALVFGLTARPADAAYRQYYSAWGFHQQRGYHYRTWYFKPSEQTSGYRHNYCLYFPDRPEYVYLYDPVKQKFWGRYLIKGKMEAQFSTLKVEDQSSVVEEIPDEKFSEPGPLPVIPGATDDVRMQALPSLPEGVGQPEKPASPPASPQPETSPGALGD